MYAAELSAGACFALLDGEAGPAAALEVGVAGAPAGDLPLKQLSHTFCGVVLWMCGKTSFFVRWSEHTTLPHLRQWCRLIQKVNS